MKYLLKMPQKCIKYYNIDIKTICRAQILRFNKFQAESEDKKRWKMM
jgi:hypothetical protein